MKKDRNGRRRFLLWSLASLVLLVSGFPRGGAAGKGRKKIPVLKEARFYRMVD